jgi:hypothetical protein
MKELSIRITFFRDPVIIGLSPRWRMKVKREGPIGTLTKFEALATVILFRNCFTCETIAEMVLWRAAPTLRASMMWRG